MTAVSDGRAEYPELVAATVNTTEIIDSIPGEASQAHLWRILDVLGGANSIGAAELLLERFGRLGDRFSSTAWWDPYSKTMRLQLTFRSGAAGHPFTVRSRYIPTIGVVDWRGQCGSGRCDIHKWNDTISNPDVDYVFDWIAKMAEACVPGLFDPPATRQPERDVVPQNARQLRNVRGLTVEELAEKVGVDPSIIREAETSGVFDVTIDPIQRLADALRTSRVALTREPEEPEA